MKKLVLTLILLAGSVTLTGCCGTGTGCCDGCSSNIVTAGCCGDTSW